MQGGGGKSPYDPGQTFRGLGEEETARQHAKTQTTQEGDFEGRTALHTHTLLIDSSVKNQFSTWQRFGKKSKQINQPLFVNYFGYIPVYFQREFANN